MGYDLSTLAIHFRASSHNSWRDDRDRMLIKAVADRIAEIVNEPQYEDVLVEPFSYGDAEQPSWMPSPVWTVPLTRDQLNDLQNLQHRKH